MCSTACVLHSHNYCKVFGAIRVTAAESCVGRRLASPGPKCSKQGVSQLSPAGLLRPVLYAAVPARRSVTCTVYVSVLWSGWRCIACGLRHAALERPLSAVIAAQL